MVVGRCWSLFCVVVGCCWLLDAVRCASLFLLLLIVGLVFVGWWLLCVSVAVVGDGIAVAMCVCRRCNCN